MNEHADILISVERRHVQNMLAGRKKVELRRRPIRIGEGSRVWMYSKSPFACVDALGIVEGLIEREPAALWDEIGAESGITGEEFRSYFEGRDIGFAIRLKRIVRIEHGVTLQQLRRTCERFHPPQFFKRLCPSGPELPLFEAALVA